MASPTRWRTKHSPRWPSCSRQSRGHRSHCSRPSSRRCHQRAGWLERRHVVARVHAVRPRLRELAHAIARQPQVVMPEVGRKPGLALQRGQELGRQRQLLPHLRQEGGAAAAPFEQHAIDAGPQRRGAPRLRCARPRGCAGSSSETSISKLGELLDRQGFEARVAKCRRQRVHPHVVGQRPFGRQRADAAAQFAVEAQRDEGGARGVERGMPRLGGGGQVQRTGDRVACTAEQCAGQHRVVVCGAGIVERAGRARACLEGDGAVADHAGTVARRVARVAQVEQARRPGHARAPPAARRPAAWRRRPGRGRVRGRVAGCAPPWRGPWPGPVHSSGSATGRC